MRLFISYAHADRDVVQRLVSILRQGGYEVWFDHDLLPGQDWKTELRRAIEESDGFVYALTPEAAASEWCQWEFSTAVTLDKPIIPVLLKAGTDIPEALRPYQYADFRQGIRSESIARLLSGLREFEIHLPAVPAAPENPQGVPPQAQQQVTVGDISGGNVTINQIGKQVAGEQPRNWTAPVVIGLILALLAVVVGVVAIPENQRNDFLNQVGLLPPTPMEGTPFAKDQVGVVLADFTQVDPNAPRVEGGMERSFEDAGIPFIRVHHPLSSRAEAQAVSELYNATIVLWGEAQLGGVQVNFEITPRQSYVDTAVNELLVSAAQLDNFEAYVFQGMDALYIVDFVQGQIAYFKQDYDGALQAFTEAAKRIPAGREADVKAYALYFYRGYIYQQKGDLNQALADYTQAIALKPDYANAYAGRGITYYFQKDYAKALADLQHYAALAGDQADPQITKYIPQLEAQLGTPTPGG